MVARFLGLLLVIFNIYLYSEEAILKIPPTTVVSYHFDIDLDFAQTKHPEFPNKGDLKARVDFEFGIFSGSEVPELTVVLKGVKFKASENGQLKEEYDSASRENPKNIPVNIAGMIDKPIRLPLTENREILTSPSPRYPLLPLEDPDGYISFVQIFLPYLKEGVRYTKDDGFTIDAKYNESKVLIKSILDTFKTNSIVNNAKMDVNIQKGVIDNINLLKATGSAQSRTNIHNALVSPFEGDLKIVLKDVKSPEDNTLNAKFSLWCTQLFPEP